MSPRTLALHLALIPGIGGRRLTRILARNSLLGRSPSEFQRLGADILREEYGLPRGLAERVANAARRDFRETQDWEARLDALGVTLVTAADAHYPKRIEAFDPDPPGLLFLYGNQRLLDRPTFAVMSSRNTPPAGLDLMERLTEQGVLSGEVLVSGHDKLEYQRTAVVPLRYGAPRILVFDRGHFRVLGENLREEAFATARLWRYEFDPKTDLTVSPFRPEAEYKGVNNQVRDRVVAGLAERIDFAIIAEGGNMAKLCARAIAAGRAVRVSDLTIDYRTYRSRGVEILDARIL